ncbi:MAG: hypothetical protein ACFCUE_04560 [Candidatus Bathyarchaeia archaeon]
MKLNPKDFAIFLLGALVGIYGNWLIAFFEKLKFPTEANTLFWGLIVLSILWLIFFFTYFIIAFKYVWSPYIVASLHILFTFFIFIFQSSSLDNLAFLFLGVLIFLSIIVTNWVSFSKHRFLLSWRWLSWLWKRPIVGILNDMGYDLNNNPDISVWTNVPPTVWAELIKKAGLNVKFINVANDFDEFSAILNPYGSVYPELDLRTFSSKRKILDFVAEGGIFVNVADIPTFYAYNPKLKRRIETTKPKLTVIDGHVKSLRLFSLTPLLDELGLSILNIEQIPQDFKKYSKEEKTNVITERVAIVDSDSIRSFIPTATLEINAITSFFSVSYSEGDFIFSLPFLSHERNKDMVDTIKKAIVTEMVEKIKTKTKKK